MAARKMLGSFQEASLSRRKQETATDSSWQHPSATRQRPVAPVCRPVAALGSHMRRTVAAHIHTGLSKSGRASYYSFNNFCRVSHSAHYILDSGMSMESTLHHLSIGCQKSIWPISARVLRRMQLYVQNDCRYPWEDCE